MPISEACVVIESARRYGQVMGGHHARMRAQEALMGLASSHLAVRVGIARGSLPVMAFHGVPSRSAFSALLSALLDDFEPVHAANWDPARRAGTRRTPVALTFDDGQASVIENGLPVLIDRGVPATMFVCPGIATGTAQFWWDITRKADAEGLRAEVAPEAGADLTRWLKREPDTVRREVVARCVTLLGDTVPKNAAPVEHLERWLAAGMELGNHTWDHPCLDRCSAAEQTEQIERAHEWLTRFCGRPPASFAYPNGDWTEHSETVLERLGYRTAFLFDHRIHRRTDHPLRRSRLRLDADATPQRARAIASGWHAAVYHTLQRSRTQHASTTRTFSLSSTVEELSSPSGLTAVKGPPWFQIAAEKGEDITLDVLDWDERHLVAGAWDRLAAMPNTAFVQTRGWVETWRETTPRATQVRLIVATDSSTGAVRGLLPVAVLARRVHRRIPFTLKFLGIAGSGSNGADHLGPLADQEYVGAALFRHAAGLDRRRSLYLENLTERWHRIALASTRGVVARVTECPMSARIPPAGFDESWTSKARKNDRRRQRQLAAAGIAPVWVPAGPGFDEALTSLQRLHRQRWAVDGTGGLFDDDRLAFINRFAVRCTAPDIPWVLLLANEDGPVAAMLGFVHGETFSVYKTGWDPEFAKLGLGMALGSEAMRWAQQQGLVVFDYLRGPRAHKAELGCESVLDYSILRPRGLSGLALRLRERLSDGRVTAVAGELRRNAASKLRRNSTSPA